MTGDMLTGICSFFFLLTVKWHFDSNEMQHFKLTSYVKLC